MFSTLAEDFGCNQTYADFGNDYVGAYNAAVDKSLENNTDFVYMLSNGIPLVKFVDGEERKV
jgi:hypothetical protein